MPPGAPDPLVVVVVLGAVVAGSLQPPPELPVVAVVDSVGVDAVGVVVVVVVVEDDDDDVVEDEDAVVVVVVEDDVDDVVVVVVVIGSFVMVNLSTATWIAKSTIALASLSTQEMFSVSNTNNVKLFGVVNL